MYYQSLSSELAAAHSVSRSKLARILSSPLTIVILAAILIVAINPIGYLGGRTDDWQYLQAARCTAEQGFCYPEDHWWRRFAVVVPAGLAIRWFGETAVTVSIFPLLYSIAATALFVRLVERQFGRIEALFAGLVFVASPVVGDRILGMTIDMVELCFLFGSIFCLQSAHLRGRSWLFAPAGALLGLAILSRPTQLAMIPIFAAAFMIVPGWRRRAAPFVAGLLLPILSEAAFYVARFGDALLPWKLSLAHTRIPSSELDPSVDLTQSPLFNVAFIDGWRPTMNVSVHWTVDALINLLLHPDLGLALIVTLMLIGLDGRQLRWADPRVRMVAFLIAASAAFFGALVFAFAIDPKPRMFMPILAVACATFGFLGARRWRNDDRIFVAASLSLLLTLGAISSWDRINTSVIASTAGEWVRAAPDDLASDTLATALLAMDPDVRRLAADDGSQSNLLSIGTNPCARLIPDHSGWRVVRERVFADQEPSFVTAMRKRRLLFYPKDHIVMCLIERSAGNRKPPSQMS
jgi:4-amino-4-deoxy-L-arabinose transferase-like glycosyltransferase